MSEIEQLLRQDGASWRAETDARLNPHAETGRPVTSVDHDVDGEEDLSNYSAIRPARRRLLAPALAAAVILAVAAGLIAFGVIPTSHTNTESNRADKPFRLTLHLDRTTAPANGRSIHGYVTVVNNTGNPITIEDACNGWLGIDLRTRKIHYALLNGLVGCADRHLPEGTTNVKVTVTTRYKACKPGTKPTGDPTMPNCQKPPKNLMPPLPAGHYRAVIQTMSLSQHPSLPTPTEVTLTTP